MSVPSADRGLYAHKTEKEMVSELESLRRRVRELEESEARFRAVVENAPHANYLKDLDDRYTLVNPSFRRLAGVSADEGLGMTADTVLAGQDAGGFSDDDREVMQRRSVVKRERVFHYADGNTYEHIETKFPILDDSGNLIGVGGIDTEVTDRNRAEQALRDSENRIRTILDHVVDGVITIDESGHVESFNPAAALMFGYTADELIGRNVSMLMVGSDRQAHDRYLSRFLETGEG
jgi:two-component system sensor kinase FixL